LDMNRKVVLNIIVVLILVAIAIVVCIILQNHNQTYEPAPKEEIITAFHENYELFIPVAEFANNTAGNLYVDYTPEHGIVIENTGNESEIDSMSADTKRSIKKIIKMIDFGGIYEMGKEEIYFLRNGGDIEEGICYMGEAEEPLYIDETEKEHITGNWYYYSTWHE